MNDFPYRQGLKFLLPNETNGERGKKQDGRRGEGNPLLSLTNE